MLRRVYVSGEGIHSSDINKSYFNLSCQPRAKAKEYFYIRVSNGHNYTQVNVFMMSTGEACGTADNKGL